MLDIVTIERSSRFQIQVLKISETGAVRFFFRADKEAVLRAYSEALRAQVQIAYPNGNVRKSAIRKGEASGIPCHVLEIVVTYVQL